MGYKFVYIIVIAAAYAVLQADQAQGFSYFQVAPQHEAVKETQHHQHQHEGAQSSPFPGHHEGAAFGFPTLGGFGNLAAFGGFDLTSLKPKLQQVTKHMQTLGAMIPRMQNQMFIQASLNASENAFYSSCGTSVRHCEWVQSAKVFKKQVILSTQEEGNSQPAGVEQICVVKNHVCVGNTETCVSERNCDVAMKIKEITREGSNWSGIEQISHINNCNMESQSATDSSRMPQMYFGIGLATYDESGQKLDCSRNIRASDFKMIFLWKNSTEATGTCNRPSMFDFQRVKLHDHEMITHTRTWSHVCSNIDSKVAESPFQLKSFLTHFVPTAHYTSYFASPFTFADNFQPTLSSNGMVISGVINA